MGRLRPHCVTQCFHAVQRAGHAGGDCAVHAAQIPGRGGTDAFAQSTASEARAYRYAPSPLMKSINLVIQVLTYTAIGLCLVYVGLYFADRINEAEMVTNMAATITSMVPQGLVLAATV